MDSSSISKHYVQHIDATQPDVAVADAVVRPSAVDEANSSAKNVVAAGLRRDVVRRRRRHNLIKCSERICN